jgi:hypothetical protein
MTLSHSIGLTFLSWRHFAIVSMMQAAVATEDITPEVGCALATYQRTEPSKGVLDRLELGALILRTDSSTFVWITVDNVAFLVSETDPIRLALARMCGTSPSHVMVSFSHTHSGPEVDRDCLKLVSEKSEAALKKCLSSLQPASLGWEEASADACVNRRAQGLSKAKIQGSVDGAYRLQDWPV